MDVMMFIPHVAGCLGLLLWVSSIQAKDKKRIMIMQLIANIFYSIQYIMLGIVAAGMMNLVSTVRYCVYYKNEEKGNDNTLPLLVVFLGIIVLIGIITVRSFMDLINMAAFS